MLQWRVNIMSELQAAGWYPAKMRKEKLFGESTVQKMRHQKLVSWAEFDRLCQVLNKQPGDLLEYADDGTASIGDVEDVGTQEFADMLSFLAPHPDETELLDRWGSQYTSEKANVCLWLRGQAVPSARTAYDRLLSPGAMLWMAEVLGETPENLKAACLSATKAEKVFWRNRGRGFREVIPFDRILELYQNPDGWKYDERLLPLIRREAQGYPTAADEDAVAAILDDEMK